MTEGHELSAQDRTQLRTSIERRLALLRAAQVDAEGRWPGSAQRSGPEQSCEDAAQRSDDDEVLFAIAANDSAEVMALQAALAAVDTPAYGYCVDCRAAIPLGRLRAEPQAVRCAACQTRRESRD